MDNKQVESALIIVQMYGSLLMEALLIVLDTSCKHIFRPAFSPIGSPDSLFGDFDMSIGKDDVNLIVLFVFFVFAVFVAIAQTNEMKFTLDELSEQLEFNEQSVRTYSGNMSHREYSDVPGIYGDDHFQRPNEKAKLIRVNDTSFVRDYTRGEDYFIRVSKSSPLPDFRKYGYVQRRCGTVFEGVTLDHQKEPTMGVIHSVQQAALCLGNMPENFMSLHFIHTLSSAHSKGYEQLPISTILKDHPDRVWISKKQEVVNGQPTILLAVTSPFADDAMLSFVWLGTDLNMTIVKHQSCSVEKRLLDLRGFLSGVSKSNSEKDDDSMMEQILTQTAPHTLISHHDFQQTSSGLWIPVRTLSFILSVPNENRLSSGLEMSEFLQIASRYPDTQHLKEVVVRGYHEFLLDMESIKINEFIDPKVFETSVIPEDVPVTNLITGTSPGTIDVFLEDSLVDLEQDKSLSGSITPEKQPVNISSSKLPEQTTEKVSDTNDSISLALGENDLSKPSQTIHWLIKVAVIFLVIGLTVGAIIYIKARQN